MSLKKKWHKFNDRYILSVANALLGKHYNTLKGIRNRHRATYRRYRTHRKLFPREYLKYAKKPVNPNKVVFIEVRLPTVSNSFQLLYDELAKNYDFEIHTHFLRTTFVKYDEYKKRCVEMVRDVADAKYIFINEASSVLSSLPLREETIITQTWHGCGAFKKFGLSTADLIFGGSRQEQEKYPFYKNLNTVTISSPEVDWAYAEAMNIDKDAGIIKATGVSRTDIFYDDSVIQKAYDKLHALMPSSVGKKVILYAPTFRGRVAKAKSSNMLNVPMFYDALGDDYVVLFKHHPLVKKPPVVPVEYFDFAVDVTQLMSIEELLCVSDICISDYSSLVFEYSLFEKPMIFFAYDLDEYFDWRGFYYDYFDLAPGPVCKTNLEMLDYIQHIDSRFDKARVQAFRHKFMRSCDGHATARILDVTFGDALQQHRKPSLPPLEYHSLPHADLPVASVQKQRADHKALAKRVNQYYAQADTARDASIKQVVLVDNMGTSPYVLTNLKQQLKAHNNMQVHLIERLDEQATAEQIACLATADFIVLNQPSVVIDLLGLSAHTKVIQLWSTAFVNDKFGYQAMQTIWQSQTLQHQFHQHYTLVPVASEALVPVFEQAFDIAQKGVVRAIGSPTLDSFFDDKAIAQTKQKLYEFMPSAQDKKIVAYLSTYRVDPRKPKQKITLPLQPLFEGLYKNSVLLLATDCGNPKVLPAIAKYYEQTICNVTELLSSEELLRIADVVIGDYSPQVTAFTCTEKPIFIYAPDHKWYFKEHATNFDFSSILAGVEVQDANELLAHMANLDQYDYSNLLAVKDRFFKTADGHATTKLIDWMQQQ